MSTKRNNAVGPQVRTRGRKTGQSQGRGLVAFIVLAFVIGGLAVATQLFARSMAYQPTLGPNWNHIYAPWRIVQWFLNWQSVPTLKQPFGKAIGIGMVVAVAGLVVAMVAKVAMSKRGKGNEFLHGSARWADMKDIQAASLIDNDGVYVGAYEEKNGKVSYLRHSGPEHVLTYAPTRSGKGVGLVIPTLLSWNHSTVVADLKGELWALTAGWRKQHAGQTVMRFEPASSRGSVRWNPLDEIRVGTDNEVADVQNLATLIVDPDGKGLESHWQKTSQALFVGVILHAIYKAKNGGPPATMSEVDGLLTDPARPVKGLWEEMMTYGHLPGGKNHTVVGRAARDMMDRPDEEAGSVLSTAKSYIELYRDPVVAANTSTSDFSIRDLMNHDTPVSLYIITQPTDKNRLRPLVRIMLNMMVRILAPKQEFENGRVKANYKHRMLFMIDEFPSLGKLEIIQESLAFAAGYGLKFYLICQDINQLRSRETGYGHDELVTSNCHVQNAYPPNRLETAEHLSKMTGQTTILKEQITTSKNRGGGWFSGSESRTVQETQRPLLTPDECLRMPGPKKNANGDIEEAGDMLLYMAGYPMIYGKQPLYFKDPTFLVRAQVTAPDKSDIIRKAKPTTASRRDNDDGDEGERAPIRVKL